MSMISVQNLTFSYDGSYDNIFEDVSFQIDTDWKLGFTGRNGRGKTTFFKLLMKKYEYKGKISSSVNFEYFPFEVSNSSAFAINIIQEKSGIEDYDYWKIQKELSFLYIENHATIAWFSIYNNLLSQTAPSLGGEYSKGKKQYENRKGMK